MTKEHRVPSLPEQWRMGQSKFTRLGNRFVIPRQDVRARCQRVRICYLASYLRRRLRESHSEGSAQSVASTMAHVGQSRAFLDPCVMNCEFRARSVDFDGLLTCWAFFALFCNHLLQCMAITHDFCEGLSGLNLKYSISVGHFEYGNLFNSFQLPLR